MVTYHQQILQIHLYSKQHSGNQMELSYLMWCPCSLHSANYIVYQKAFGLITVHLSIHVNYGLLSCKIQTGFNIIRREMVAAQFSVGKGEKGGLFSPSRNCKGARLSQ